MQFLAVLILVITAELIPIPVHASSGYAYVHGTADYRTSRDQLLANVAAARSASASYIALLRQAGTSDAAAEANQIEANYDQETLAINQLSDGPIVELVPMVYVRRLTIMSGPTFLVPALAANQDVGIGTMGFSSWAWDSQYSGGTIQNPISLFEANTLPYATNGGNAANLHTELAQSGTNPWSDTSVYAQEFAYLCVDNACNWEGIAYSMRNCWNITNCSDNVGGGRWHVDIFANFVPSSDGHLFTIANPHRDCNGASGHYNCNVTSALNLAQGTLSGYLCAGTATNFFNAATYTDQSTGVVDNWSGIGNADWTCGGSMYYAMRTSSSWPITQFKLANWPSSVIAVAATNDGSTGETQYAAIRSDGVFVHALRSAAGIWANSGQFIPVGGRQQDW